MAIVLVHAFASAFLYIRERFREVCPSPDAGLSDGNNHSCFQWRSGRRLDSAQQVFFENCFAFNRNDLPIVCAILLLQHED